MKQTVKIEILMPSKVQPGDFKKVYQMSVVIDDAMLFDFTSVIKGLRCIYSPDAIFSFQVLP